MATMREIAAAQSDARYKEIYTIIADRLQTVHFAADGLPTTSIQHTADDVATFSRLQNEIVQSNYVSQYGGYRTLSQERAEVKQAVRVVMDGFANPVNSLGTEYDPFSSSYASQPLLIAPQEAASLYANGGLTKIIIDKKSKGVLLNGYNFESDLFDSSQLADLLAYANSKRFMTYMEQLFRDALIFGGAMLYPVFYADTPVSFGMNIAQLIGSKIIGKNCLAGFVEADRWNTTVIPDYNITTEDYINPKTIYVPLGGYAVHRDRFCRILANDQPYWSKINQIGWGVSDFTSYQRSLMGYELMAISVPIMCQQMSLLVHELPLDGIIAQNGVQAAKKWQKENEEQLRGWSIINPRAINSFGHFTTVNRTYTGFENLMDTVRKDVSAKSGIPESVLFFTQQKAMFSKSDEDVLLKQSETLRMLQHEYAAALSNVIPYIAASLWGCDDFATWQKYKDIRVNFDTPVISSPSQRAEIGFKYASSIKVLVDSGFTMEQAVHLAGSLLTKIQLPEDVAELTQSTSMEADDKAEMQGDVHG